MEFDVFSLLLWGFQIIVEVTQLNSFTQDQFSITCNLQIFPILIQAEKFIVDILISSQEQDYLSFYHSFQQYVADRNKYNNPITIKGENPCPMRKSSYLSQLLYFWAEPFVWQGYKNPLSLSDLWDLDSNLTSNELVPKFDDALNPLIEKAKSSKLMCGSCHIRNVLIGVKYKNCRGTLDVYLLFAIWMGQIQSKHISSINK